MIRKWVIYKIVSPSKRVYIGKTSDFSKRMSAYRRASHGVINQRLLYRSLIKYSFENHIVNKLEEGVFTLEEINAKETFWIKEYKSNTYKYPECNGLNLTDGGDGIIGYIPSQETRDKLRKVHLGRKATPEARERMKIAQKGRIVSAEARKNISIAGRGRITSEKTRKMLSKIKLGIPKPEQAKKNIGDAQIRLKGKKILVYNKRGEFIIKCVSIGAVAKMINGSQGNISSCLLGVRSSHKGYNFKYAS